MRKICLFTTLGLILISQVQAEKIKAWIILDSDTIEVTLDVSFDSFSQDPDYEKLQKRIKYIDATGKEMTLRPEEAREVQFTYKGEDIRMVSRRNTLRLNSPFSSKTYVFLKLEIDGELQMFTYFSHAIGAYNPSTGGSMGGLRHRGAYFAEAWRRIETARNPYIQERYDRLFQRLPRVGQTN